MKLVNPGKNGCGGEGLSDYSEDRDLTLAFLLSSYPRSKFIVTRGSDIAEAMVRRREEGGG